MAFELHRGEGLPVFAASAINPGKIPVMWSPTLARNVVPVASPTSEPLGFADITASVAAGAAINVYEAKHIVKAVAVASLGANANVGIGSTNGALGPVAKATGTATWRVGVALEAAAAAETFSVYVSPQQLAGLQ